MRSEKIINRQLRQARLRSGYSIKTVASLIGHRHTDQIYRYESAGKMPTLVAALKLEAIYGVSVRTLFQDAFMRARQQVHDRSRLTTKTIQKGLHVSANAPAEGVDYCAFAELLRTPNLPPNEVDHVYAHVRYLAKALLLRD